MSANTATVSTDDLIRALAAIEYAEEELRRARTLIRELFALVLPDQEGAAREKGGGTAP